MAVLLLNLIFIFHLFRSKGEHRIGGILFDPSLSGCSYTGCVREAAGLLKVQSHAGNQNNHLNNYISSDYVFTRSLQYILNRNVTVMVKKEVPEEQVDSG